MPQKRLSSRSPVRRMCNDERITIKRTEILEMQLSHGKNCTCPSPEVGYVEMSEDESEDLDKNSSHSDDSLDEMPVCLKCRRYISYSFPEGAIPESAQYNNDPDKYHKFVEEYRKKLKSHCEDKCKTEKSNNFKPTQKLGVCFGIVFFVCLGIGFHVLDTLEDVDEINISDLQNAFPSQPKQTFRDIETIINDVLKLDPIHPAVFLFLYKYDSPKFSKFLESIAKFASSKLKVWEPHIVLEEKDYINPEVHKDYGYLIYKYKPELDSKKVMVIQNLHHMPGKTAQALHSFCDEFTPLTDRAVYILTLQVDSFDGAEMRIAVGKLRSVWSDLDPDLLEPLITRVTSTVMKFY